MGRERQGLGSLLGPYFLGERADDLEGVRQRIREMGYLGHRTGWIEPACWDLIGKARGQPVYELLGGEGGEIRLYASTGEIRPLPERVESVVERREEGFDTVKLRVHAATLEEDVALIRGVREAVGDSIALGVDANQGWRVAVVADAPRWDAERALAFCRAAEDLGFSWVEEPLPMDDFVGLARLAEAVGIPIAGGELHVRGLPELESMIERRCYDLFQPDAAASAPSATSAWPRDRGSSTPGSRPDEIPSPRPWRPWTSPPPAPKHCSPPSHSLTGQPGWKYTFHGIE